MAQGAGWPITRVMVVIDLVGSTAWRIEHGDASADRMQVRFSALVSESTAAVGGRVIEDRGDGFLCSFDSANSALHAAVGIARKLAELDELGVSPPALRTGIAAGDVVERGREMYGLPVVVAARLEQIAEPGAIVCTDVVRALAGTRTSVSFTSPRSLDLDGLPDPVDLWTVEAGEFEIPDPAVINPTGNLPSPGTRFFGRDQELRRLQAAVADRPLTTITGPGGVGKTRLAIELAAALGGSFRDGAWFVALDSATSVEGVLGAVRRVLTLAQSNHDGIDSLAAALRTSEALVVLDNCEQVSEAVADLASALVDAAPGLRLVATSRTPLGLRCEAIWPLGPLEAPAVGLSPESLLDNASVALLVDRTGLVDGVADLGHDDLVALAEIARRLDGLPLAIELAAGKLSVLRPTDMVARTDDLLQLLAGAERDRPDRHRTIDAAVDWSVAALSPLQRYVLVGVAVFSGGAPLDGVAAVCPQVGPELIDLLSGLVDASLIRRDTSGRFTMLSPIRETILQRDDFATDCEEAARRHLGFYAEMARRYGSLLQRQTTHLSRFAEEDENLGVALDTARRVGKAQALSLAGDLGLYWVLSGRANEGDRRFSEILATPGDVEPPLLARAMRNAAMAAGLGTRYARSEQLLLAARALYSELDRADSIAYCDIWLARNAVVQCHFGLLEPAALDLAYDRLERSVKTLDGAGDRMGVLLAYPYLGWARLLQGDRAAAARLTDELVDRARSGSGDLVSVYAVAHCGFMRSMLGELDVAAAELDRAMAALADSGDTQNLLITGCVDVSVRHRLGDRDRARSSAGLVVDCLERCQSSEWESLALAIAAHVVAASGDWETAAEVVTYLEQREPTWRAAMRNTGIDPGAVLEHAAASSPNTVAASRADVLRALRRSLEGIRPLDA